jgi:hypothetical protein
MAGVCVDGADRYCIATATHFGTLGTAAKVSPRSDSEHVIYGFTRDYTDVDDVNRVRNGLRRIGVDVIGYKHLYAFQDIREQY